jgi:hypothetical protein
MKLQRYDICHDSFDINVSLSKKVSPYGEWVKADEALEEIARLRATLKVISDLDCDCFEDDSCAVCLARLALEPT